MSVFVKLLLSALVFLVALLISRQISHWLGHLGRLKGVGHERIYYIQKVFQMAIYLVACFLVFFILGVGYEDLGLIFSSVFAVIGIALFAQWSILSNLTASVIIFFFFPYRVGDRIALLTKDKEDAVEGVITDITLFHLIIAYESGDKLTYPASLVFQNPIVIKRAKELGHASE